MTTLKISEGARYVIDEDQLLDPKDGRDLSIVADGTTLVIRDILDGSAHCIVEFDDGEVAGQTLVVPVSQVEQLNTK